ncbi:M43 family zinc metalloprotease [Algoriphagus boritolerans]|uniref:Por secretion system C-terminal sorting domain-containing protein n=1 Tax=Algoriphagus boritolerans DSM 17298 = JCM 18970 TaxID=1120964 RepID=A0A1H5VJL0_9BACT|nr:M43 family zinc metalloprotease [Algoriphagus boritolerans]SEF87011.1 Por secretion system C-terminal sorting domain-containing protein [Algoriphagus boritolerans DSM 17298 = JCM 18970]
MRKGLQFFGVLFFLKGFLFFSIASFGQKITPTAIDQPQVFGFSASHSHSEKCAHTLIESKIEKEMGYFGSKSFFEDWIDQKITDRRTRNIPLAKTLEGPRLIPVVVHVIHNGTPLGSGANIPDSQIFEQIRILNEDFRRLNADAVRTPAEFLPVAADADIAFVLAKQDPNGFPTNGIVRLQGTKNSYDPNSDAVLIGQLSQWNPAEYMNIYVVPLVQPFIGYASFPISDLPGLNFSPTPAIIDGVTIDYRFFGVGGNATSSSLGRTATHEVGHYFGLRHIWGDGGCGVDDFVTDTPEQDNSNSTCNANPSRFSCGSNDMIQNYMDYTPDACMNLFTRGQVERFNVVLENSPRRVTLVNNRATQEPQLLDLDLSLNRIIQPVDAICDLIITPEIEVQNAGSMTVTSARIEYIKNGTIVENKNFSLNLETGETAILTFATTQLDPGDNEVEFRITQVNNQADQNSENNSKLSNPVLQGEIDLPYTFDIQNFPSDWVISNPDQAFTWERRTIFIGGEAQQSVYIRHFEYEGIGELDYLISPILDLTKYPNSQLVFEVAHAPYDQPGYQDELIISVSEDCGSNFDLVDVNYQKSGPRLETSPPTLDEFIPTSNEQFRTEIFNLSDFQSLGKVRVSITARNSYGNNIFLRNIRILPSEELRYGIRVEEILNPTAISSGDHEEEVIRVTNTGNLSLNKFLLTRTTNSNLPETYLVSEITLAPEEQLDLDINKSTFNGKNRLRFSVSEPNFDQNPTLSIAVGRYHLEATESVLVPWRQNFNSSTTLTPWTAINPENDLQTWTITPIANGSGVNNATRLENGLDGNSYWLGSPVFNLSGSRQASIFFDLAAGQVNPSTKLSLLASRDGGLNYDTVWMASGQELATVTAGEANPNSPGDYSRKYANLSDFAGSEALAVRLAFVLEITGNENDPVYLDNLELFLNANPDPVIPAQGSTVLYPNPARDYFSLAFNLPDRENITIQIISATGAIVHEVDYPGTLNQTYTFSTELFRSGVYIIRISSDTLQEMKRLLIN